MVLGNITQPSTLLDKANLVAGNLTQLSVLGLILGVVVFVPANIPLAGILVSDSLASAKF
jgi:hypothetical protein